MALAIAVYCLAVEFQDVVWLTVPLGLLTLLFAPGYGIVAIGAGERKRWPWYFTLVVVVGLSVAFNVAIGLLLLLGNYGLLPLVLAISSLIVIFLGAVAQFARASPSSDDRFATMVRSELSLKGFSAGQRAAAYTLLIALMLVLAGLTYIASVNPREKSDVSLGISGSQGSVASLPIRFPSMHPTTLVVTVGNNNTAQAWDLFVSASATAEGSPLNNSTVPPAVTAYSVNWSSPLFLGDGSFSETSLGEFAPNEVITLNVAVQFNATLTNHTGWTTNYTVTFELIPAAGGSPVRSTSWFFLIFFYTPGRTSSPLGEEWV